MAVIVWQPPTWALFLLNLFLQAFSQQGNDLVDIHGFLQREVREKGGVSL